MAAITNTYAKYDSRTFDVQFQLADTQTVTTSAAMTVSSSAKIVNVGAAHFKGDAVFDVSTVDNTEGDDVSRILIQGSNSATFATGNVNLAERSFGDAALTGETSDNLGDERLVVPFENIREGTIYQYIRGYVLAAGTGPSMIINIGYVSPRN
jgi:hypothetical protein